MQKPSSVRRVVIPLLAGILIAAASFLYSCCGLGHDAAIRSGRRVIPAASQADALFPDAHHYISYFNGLYGTPTWQMRIGIGGRYVIEGSIPIRLSYLRRRVVGSGPPSFVLYEVARIEPRANGGLRVTNGRSIQFGQSEWEAVVRAGGSLRPVLGDDAGGDPVPGFDEYIRPR